MGERVALGPELEQRLGLAGGADRRRVYDALMSYTDGKRLSVRRATADEIGRYRPQAKRDLKAPIFAVQADDITLLVEYDMQANTIPFVGQLSAADQPPRPAAPPQVEQRAAPPVPVAAPKPAAPPPAPVATPKPPAPAVAVATPKPAPAVAAPAPRAAPVVPKPQARVAAPPPVEPQLRPNGPCEVKPVMTEQDLVNCRAGAPIAPRVDPGPPPAASPQVRVAPQPATRRPATACEIKPVMSEEDLIACGIRR